MAAKRKVPEAGLPGLNPRRPGAFAFTPEQRAGLCRPFGINPLTRQATEFVERIEWDVRVLLLTDKLPQPRRRGRPSNEAARYFAWMLASRIEDILGIRPGFSKRGGPYARALLLCLRVRYPQLTRPDRYIPRLAAPILFPAEEKALKLRLAPHADYNPFAALERAWSANRKRHR